MDTPNHARSEPSERELLRDINLRRWNLAVDLERLGYARTDAFEELVKAIAKGSRTLETQILRSWGIWR